MSQAEPDIASLRRQLVDLSRHHLDAPAAELVERLARPAVRLEHSDQPTRSHLGGVARLAAGTKWPHWGEKPLSLVAVIDLEDVAGFDTDVRLPGTGLLNFFYEADEQQAWGFEFSHRDGWRVIYVPTAEAETVAAPAGALRFASIAMEPRQTLTIPGWEEPSVAPILPPHREPTTSRVLGRFTFHRKQVDDEARRVEEERRNAYFELEDAWRSIVDGPGPRHRIGGWPDLVQGPIWRECDVVSQGLPLGNPTQANDPRVRALADTQDDWRMLLQLDTDDEAGWMWGDVGTLYFAVRDSLELPATFAEPWMVFQCG